MVFAAYMSLITHLQQTFTRSAGWPREGITAEEAMADMLPAQSCRVQRRRQRRAGRHPTSPSRIREVALSTADPWPSWAPA
jgi:hypothetical protein